MTYHSIYNHWFGAHLVGVVYLMIFDDYLIFVFCPKDLGKFLAIGSLRNQHLDVLLMVQKSGKLTS